MSQLSHWAAMGGYGTYVWASFAVAAAGYLWMAFTGSARARDVMDEDDDA